MGTNLGRQADDFLFAVFTGISSNDQPVLYVNCELRPHGGDSSTGRRGRDRTCNHRFRKPVLYPIELRARRDAAWAAFELKDDVNITRELNYKGPVLWFIPPESWRHTAIACFAELD